MDYDALIVGAGPVGLTLATELIRFGLRIGLVDRAAERTDKSKALVIWSRTLELLDRGGSGAALCEAGHRVEDVNIFAGVKKIGHLSLAGAPTPYPFALMIPQSETERILAAHLESLGGSIQRSTELLRFETRSEGITAQLKGADGTETSVTARWLIGCDGAHSAVRHQLGLEFHGDTLISNWALADLHLKGPNTPSAVEVYWHSSGALIFFPMGGERYRVICDVGVAADAAPRPDPTLTEIQAALDERGPGQITAERPIWLASFRINERKVRDYRVGNVFLAGDAAHIHSPAGGQGMNTGMQDAMNLAWKLALVHSGRAAAERLLPSYSAERSRVGEQILAVTGKATAAATLHGDLKQAIRNELASFILGIPAVQRQAVKIATEISIGYPHSPLNGPATHAVGGPQPGERAPLRPSDTPIGAGNLARFAICADQPPSDPRVLAPFAALVDTEVRPAYRPGGIWLIRPDGYVAMTAAANEWQRVTDYLDGLGVASA